MIDLKAVVVDAAELLEGEDDQKYREGVIDLASVLAFPNVPLAVSNELVKTALGEYDKGNW